MGYSLSPNFSGKGYGKEAVKLAIDIAFKDLKLHRLEAGIDPANTQSIALAKLLGLVHEGFSRRRLYLDAQWRDMELFVILSEDVGIVWRPKKNMRLPRRG